jgi:hypothetical protein
VKDFLKNICENIDMSEVNMIINTLICMATLYIVVKGYSRSSKKYKEELINNKKADIKIEIIKTGGEMRTILVTNIGQSTAKNICIDWKDIVSDRIRINEMHKLPFPILNKSESFDFYALVNYPENNKPVITVMWEDSFSNDNRKDIILSF